MSNINLKGQVLSFTIKTASSLALNFQYKDRVGFGGNIFHSVIWYQKYGLIFNLKYYEEKKELELFANGKESFEMI
jgi:hypothetical protein